MPIGILTEEDAPRFQALRLRGLQETPDAFAVTAEEFRQETLAHLAKQLAPEGNPPHRFMLGAFDQQDKLIGVVGFFRERLVKLRHRGMIWGMYVLPEMRGQGIGKALMQELLRCCQSIPDLEQLELEVVTTNTAARTLYLALGFRVFGLQPRALHQDGRYFDEELMTLSLSSET